MARKSEQLRQAIGSIEEAQVIQCKRAYDDPHPDDGYRVLVDRLWPRNRRKEQMALDAWMTDLAPSSPLRRSFKTGEIDFAAFRQAYRQELAVDLENWRPLLDQARRGTVTLVYAARDQKQNNAVVLAEWLEEALAQGN